MSAFDYLAVLVSIVLGLGVANILSGYAAIIRNRRRIRSFWPTYVTMANLFLIHIQMWWSMYGLRNVETWTFPMFLFTILQPVLLYLMSAVLVPDFSSEGPVDLEDSFFREINWFFRRPVRIRVREHHAQLADRRPFAERRESRGPWRLRARRFDRPLHAQQGGACGLGANGLPDTAALRRRPVLRPPAVALGNRGDRS